MYILIACLFSALGIRKQLTLLFKIIRTSVILCRYSGHNDADVSRTRAPRFVAAQTNKLSMREKVGI